MSRRPPRSTRTDTLFPYTTLFRSFGEFTALDEVSVQIREGAFFPLLGPSGCGKTTLLRQIGGFDDPTSGSIRLDGHDMTGAPANLRPNNMVFQRSEEGRVRNACVITSRSRWWPYHLKHI